jgi:predicted phage-related endonuclease
MKDVLAVLKNGKPSEARNKYMMELVAERMTDNVMERFVTDAMQHGIDQEPHAVAAYEALSGELTETCGFFPHPRIEFFGATPDRLLGEDGLVECKCPSTIKFIEWRREGVVPDEHKPQMLAQLACTGRKYVDFVAFDPRVLNPDARLFVRRFEPSQEEIAAVEKAAEQFLAEVDALFELVNYGKAA